MLRDLKKVFAKEQVHARAKVTIVQLESGNVGDGMMVQNAERT
jgi:hypothetical protein